MNNYSLRINISLQAYTDGEAKKKAELLLRELPKVEGSYVIGHSLYNKGHKKVISKVS